jgi:hypothetical protein
MEDWGWPTAPETPPIKRTLREEVQWRWYLMTYPEQADCILGSAVVALSLVGTIWWLVA